MNSYNKLKNLDILDNNDFSIFYEVRQCHATYQTFPNLSRLTQKFHLSNSPF